MTTSTPRRWFRLAFSLRTLFVVVTVFGCWLGYSLNWIKQRHAALSSEFAGRLMTDPNDRFFPGPVRAPGFLWVFGEEGVSVVLTSNATDDQRSEVQRLFPEAKIYEN
jgi:hypothetical protein